MLLRIDHETRLTYSEPAAEHVVELRMAPPSDEDQTSLGYRLRTTPGAPATAYRDGFGNRVDLFNINAACQEVANSLDADKGCGGSQEPIGDLVDDGDRLLLRFPVSTTRHSKRYHACSGRLPRFDC
jgi:hypothetical protein